MNHWAPCEPRTPTNFCTIVVTATGLHTVHSSSRLVDFRPPIVPSLCLDLIIQLKHSSSCSSSSSFFSSATLDYMASSPADRPPLLPPVSRSLPPRGTGWPCPTRRDRLVGLSLLGRPFPHPSQRLSLPLLARRPLLVGKALTRSWLPDGYSQSCRL